MTPPQALLAFTAAAGLLTVTPGLDTALVLRTAVVEGPRRSLLAGAGICLGCLTWGLVVSAGLGALLAVSRLAYDLLRIAGAGYLLWLGGRMFLAAPAGIGPLAELDAPRSAERRADAGARRWFVRGYLTNVLNPKVGVFYVTFLPQFVPSGVSVPAFVMLLAAIHAGQGLLWFSALNAATRPLASWLGRPRVTLALNRVTGAVLVGFGLELALGRRR